MYDVTKIKSLYFGGGGKIILHLYTYNKPPPFDLCKNWSGLCAKFEISGTTENMWIYSFMYLYTYRLIHVYINITSKQWEEK